MRSIVSLGWFLVLASALSGCATIYTTAAESDFTPYGGVQGDLWVIETSAEPRDDRQPNAFDWLTVALVSLDIPFSAIADTLLLPYTLTVHGRETPP